MIFNGADPMRLFIPIVLLLAACGSQPGSSGQASNAQSGQAGGIPAAAPPAQLCEQARKILEQLGAKGAIDYDDQGTATVPQEIWMGMAEQHSQFAQTLALHAACAHPDGSAERNVVIRNESGVVLMEASVPVNLGLGSIPNQ
jgi:hypothetical protein